MCEVLYNEKDMIFPKGLLEVWQNVATNDWIQYVLKYMNKMLTLFAKWSAGESQTGDTGLGKVGPEEAVNSFIGREEGSLPKGNTCKKWLNG